VSLDYPFYEQLKRRRHPAAKWWRLGDALYYLGLVPAVFTALPALISLLDVVCGWWPSRRPWPLVTFLAAVLVFLAGARLKLRSWRMAARDGIYVDDY
jgi:hypothetical protein